MSRLQLLAAVLIGGAAACSHPASQPRTVGPVIGESTAPGPSDPTRPPPRSPGVTEVSRPLHGTPTPVANPAPTVDTMPSTLEPSGNSTQTPVVSGVISGAAPVGTAPNAGTGTAGPNGPGTGNTTTPTGPATGGAPTTSAPATNAPATTAPRTTAPAAPTPPPSNGPGTGNTVNAQPLPATPPAQAPVTPR